MSKYTQEIIDHYVMNDLPEETRITFEEEMHNDEELRKEVETAIHIVNAFQRKGERSALEAIEALSSEKEMREIISNAENKYRSNNSGIKRFIIGFSSVAAIALILIYVGFQPKYSSSLLFDEYYSSEVFEITPSRGDEPDSEQEKLISELNSAVDLLKTNQANKAVEKLIRPASSDNFEFQQEAEWYLALAYIKDNQREKAEKTLSEIIKKESIYTKQAEKLLRKLKERRWF